MYKVYDTYIMRKNIILPFVIIILILGCGLNPIFNERIIVKSQENSVTDSLIFNIDRILHDKNNDNPWTPEDEGDHFPTGWEYWWNYMMLTLDDGSHWDIAVMFLSLSIVILFGFTLPLKLPKRTNWFALFR